MKSIDQKIELPSYFWFHFLLISFCIVLLPPPLYSQYTNTIKYKLCIHNPDKTEFLNNYSINPTIDIISNPWSLETIQRKQLVCLDAARAPMYGKCRLCSNRLKILIWHNCLLAEAEVTMLLMRGWKDYLRFYS